MAEGPIARSRSQLAFSFCPRCARCDVRGPFDTEPAGEKFELRRSWYCVECWWSTSIVLFDDVKLAAAKAARKPSTRGKAAAARG